MAHRVVVLVTSPRLPAGLLSGAAWDLIRSSPVLAARGSEQSTALIAAGIPIRVLGSEPAGSAAVDEVLAAVASGPVVWLAEVGQEPFLRDLGLRVARRPDLAYLEVVYGSWDPPGARLLEVVTVMDRLAGPGGDPWKRQQTHQSLSRYLLEEAYEAYDAIEAHDLDALREELGDVLLQVILHARMAEEAVQPWSIDDLAGDLVDKLIRRNPHVFGGAEVTDVDEIIENWERIKREEKARGSAMDGIALSQPALALAAKIVSRARRAGAAVPAVPARVATDEATDVAPEEANPEEATPDEATAAAEYDLALALWELVLAADRAGLDAEAALRRLALNQLARVQAGEATEKMM